MYEAYSYGQTPFNGLDDQVTCYNISSDGDTLLASPYD